jgi:hypothetical protein
MLLLETEVAGKLINDPISSPVAASAVASIFYDIDVYGIQC